MTIPAPDSTLWATLLRRFQELRTNAEAASGRPGTLLDEALEELATAAEELRVTEEELRRNRDGLADARTAAESAGAWNRTLLDASADAVLVTDGSGTIRDLNPAASALLGVRRETLRGKPLAVYVPEAERRAFRARLATLLSEGRPHRFELRIAPRGAEALWAEAAVAPFRVDEASTALHWSLRDATARRAREAARGDALDTLRLALDAAGEAMAVLDVDGSVLCWNRAAERLLGWTEEDVVGRPLPAEGADPAALPETLALRTPAGEKKVSVAAAPLSGSGGISRGTLVTLSALAAQGPGKRPAWPEDDLVRMVGAASGADFFDRLRTALGAGIFLGLLAAGDRLPSIRQLARRTGVDHRQVSSAYRRLEIEGMVEVRSRYGAVVAGRPPSCEPPELESAAWVAQVAAEAAALQVKMPQVAELVRRWTTGATVRCVCVEGTEDGRVALASELEGRWGFTTEAVPAPAAGERSTLGAAVAGAHLVATTPFHAAAAEAAARAAGIPVVVLRADDEAVAALGQALAAGPAAAVVADPAFGERLRALPGGERLRIVDATDPRVVAALDEAEPVLLTRAAQQRIQRPLRLLAPVSPAFSAGTSHELAAVLVGRNLSAERAVD